ncbi:MAG TPA: hypothetical protein VFQ90_10040 [Stellaceae bacterium]|jgi:hypothetical protein|nr:hypothetical protein [Stellaceae bacterium]
MLRQVYAVLIAGALTGLWSDVLSAEPFSVVELATPHQLGRSDSLELQIVVGQLPRGSRLVLTTVDGQTLGAVTPFPPGNRTNSATIPVPRSVMADNHLPLRLQVIGPSEPPRAPLPEEVRRVDLNVVPKDD